MLLAIVAMLIHPQIAPQPLSAEKVEASQTASAAMSSDADFPDVFLPLAPTASETPSAETAIPDMPDQPVAESSMAALPDAPMPAPPEAPAAPPSLILANPAKPMTISVDELRAETQKKDRLWMALGIASHSAATFDAWTTRHAITTAGAQELDPLLKPFAGNASIYLAIQVGPALMDYAAKRMMYNSHSWVRRLWWVPQTASFVTSIVSGAHNLAVE